MNDSFPTRDQPLVIQPVSGWRMLDWRELWAYRELLYVLAARDLQVRYKQTLLGAAWAVLRPLTLMAVFTLVFGRIARLPSDGLPYPVFVYAGLLPWMFFASAVGNAAQSMLGSAQLVSKVYFPRLIVPLASAGSALADLLVASALLLVMMPFFGVPWDWHLALVPLLIVGIAFTALGVGTLLAAATVTYRDFTHITPFLLQAWMFATPVVFPASVVPPQWRWLLELNPMTGLVEAFRCAFLGRPIDTGALALSLAIAVAVFVVAIAYFEKVERRFADML